MQKFWRSLCGAVVAAVALPLVVGMTPAAAVGATHTGIVGEVPTSTTPRILDGTVHDIVQVGTRIVVAGTFTQVQDAPANGGAATTWPYVFAFDSTTGRIDRAFDPQLNQEVRALAAGPNGTVYVGGIFNTVNGATVRRLTQLSLATGDRVPGFTTPAINAGVNDLVLNGNRLYVAGVFTTVANAFHGGLAALNATTGAALSLMGVDVAQNHNWPDAGDPTAEHARAPVGVDKIDVTPDGRRMVAIGNFQQADGLPRDQAVLLRIPATGAASVDPGWRTRRYEADCYYWAFDSYVRDVQFSPDGSYFAISTSGGANPGTLCDSLSRWETTATGDDVQPTWTMFSGGDSLFSVEITGAAIYTGGHQRWMNNTYGRDFAAAGAVPRPGISAHDPRTGAVLAWNPGRHPRGVGAEALLATTTGLYVGMDTPYIGNYQYSRPGLAYFTLVGGSTLPSEDTGSLPANVYLGGRTEELPGGGTAGAVLHRVNAGGPLVTATDGGPDWTADDADTNPLRSTTGTATVRGPLATIDGTVPASTPAAVFDDERAGIGAGLTPTMSWHLPVAAGQTVDVRLYFAERDDTVVTTGSHLFDVALEGATRMSFYDMLADVGPDVGTVKTFTTTATDGVVDLDFTTLLGNPVVAAIEVVESTGTATPGPVGVDDVLARWYEATATPVPDREVGTGGVAWSRARGAFMAGSDLFYGYPAENGDYYLWRRSFDGTAFGPATQLDPYNDPDWSDVLTGTWWFDVIPNFYRGMVPNFYAQLPGVSSMVFSNGRLYYTRTGFAGLYERTFSVDSGIVGAEQRTAAPAGFSDVSGAFLSGGRLYWATRSTGELRSTAWNAGAPDAAAGRLEDGTRSWATRALFIGPGPRPTVPNVAPTAVIAPASCTGLTCTFTSSGSTDSDGTIASRSWAFGDGTTSTATSPSKTFATAGTYVVTLTVTDDDGAVGTATQTVVVNSTTPAGIALRGATGTSARAVSSVSIVTPSAVQSGDGMLLVLSTNSAVSGTAPAGWTLVGSRLSGTGPNSQVWRRVATATDAGAPVPVALSGQSKVTLQLLAYSGTNRTNPVTRFVSAARTTAATSYATPASTATAGSVVVSIWTDKSNAARTWSGPAGLTARSNLTGVGSGDVATLVADAPVTVTGGVPARTATVPTASTRAAVWTIVLARAT
jgi:PKD repeat protein